MRVVVSLVIALVASLGGTALLWYGGGNTVLRMSQYAADGDAGLLPLLAGAGALLLGVAGVSVRWSPLGAIAAGGVHVLFALVALLVPTTTSGVGSPAIRFLDLLVDIDPGLASGGFYLVAFGGTLLIGAALLGVGILSRPSRPRLGWRIASGAGGLLALGAAGWAFAAGGEFSRRAFQMLAWDLGAALAVTLAALLFGALIAPSGRSPIGAWIAGPVLALLGIILLVAEPTAYADAPSGVLATLPVLGWSGAVLAVGLSVTGLALGVTLRPLPASGQETDARAV